ncbi:MAG: hypothetical protein A2W01_01290 [Candidatus Solincola sediminis]|uniref:Oxidoreductase molybdopterin-binding domain-containing protein n=1 Tax=Candidatus Solincola sediminis TaxID=1797199 RepID=A0A1F2WHL8_9ACTN|nr:MAG: hypothetical protein A2Y75_03735 [Candidatus Solincola sediminis]OFW58754.1 MAG: hypothetical protein A2W01_01290 [Candidatus Solincola sediminis]
MRKIILTTLALLLALLIAGCGGSGKSSGLLRSEARLEGMYEACRHVEISDPAGARPTIESDELRGFPRIDVTTKLKRSNGMEYPGTWSGARLSEVLAEHGVGDDFQELRFIAWDDYAARVSHDIAMRADTILAYEQDGEELPREQGPMRLVVGSEDGFYWILMIVRIEIVR